MRNLSKDLSVLDKEWMLKKWRLIDGAAFKTKDDSYQQMVCVKDGTLGAPTSLRPWGPTGSLGLSLA